jgi:7-carboxy-7-deazaguanine synthase
MKLPISEVFSSIQGEGITAGMPSVFLRLGGCNLMCGGQGTQYDGELHNGATWRCDTLEVWMQAQMKSFEEILSDQDLQNIKSGFHLIITGGEPLMHQNKIIDFLKWLRVKVEKDVFVEVETNGTILPTVEFFEEIDQFNISPKLANSGNEKATRYKPDVISFYANVSKRVQFKYVVSGLSDFEEIRQDFFKLHSTHLAVFMPAGENQELLNQSRQEVAQLCIDHGIRFTDRMHVVIWNKKTGV